VSKSSDGNSNSNSTSTSTSNNSVIPRRDSTSLPQRLDIRSASYSSSITIDSLLSTTTTSFAEDQKKERPLVDWYGYFDTQNVSAGRRQAALLRHFRYMMVPWMEAGDPLSHFGVDMMYFAQEHPPIQNAIVELAANQKSLIQDTRDDLESAKEKNNRRHTLEGPAKRVADSLSAIVEYLRSGPTQWRHHASYEMGLLGSDSTASSIEEPLRSLCKLHSRFGMLHTDCSSEPS
jgi:hypothetical protein